MPAARFHLLPPLEADAATQMAYDLHLLNVCDGDPHLGFLRFYRMTPPAVTIGRNQQWRRVIDPQVCSERGWDWIRRPTGGGALLHQQEINYAVVLGDRALPIETKFGFRDVLGAVFHALAGAIGALGQEPEVYLGRRDARSTGHSRQHGLCGRSLTGCELAVPAGKVVAAAQVLRSNALLQHGTIYLRAPEPADRFWPSSTPGLGPDDADRHWADIAHAFAAWEWEAAANVLTGPIADGLGVTFAPAPTTCPDWDAVRRQVRLWQVAGWHNRR